MAAIRKTFPTLTKAERKTFDLYLAASTRVSRPVLVDLLFGELNSAPIVEVPGKIGNQAWRTLHADYATPYVDESPRKREGEGSQVETVRAYAKRIATAYAEAFGKTFPLEAFKLTFGEAPNTVDFWRVS